MPNYQDIVKRLATLRKHRQAGQAIYSLYGAPTIGKISTTIGGPPAIVLDGSTPYP